MNYRLVSIALTAVLLLLVYSWSARVLSTAHTPANRLPAVEFDTFIVQKSSPPMRSFSRFRPPGTYTSGDTVTEVRYDLNSVREFSRIKGTQEELYREFYLDTGTLKQEGAFRDGWYVGTRRFYAPNGQLEKEIDYRTNTKKLYGKSGEPYDSVFSFMQKKGRAILERYFDSEFIDRHIIQNTNRSYYYGSSDYTGSSYAGSWFEVPQSEPVEFLMRYDITLQDTIRDFFIEFTLDSLGRLKRDQETTGLIYSKGKRLAISRPAAEKLALRNGLSEDDKPFSYYFNITGEEARRPERLEFIVCGSPDPHHGLATESELSNKNYINVVIDPWTGKFLRTEHLRLVHTKCD